MWHNEVKIFLKEHFVISLSHFITSWLWAHIATTIYKLVVAFFFKYFKSRILAIAGGAPSCTPRPSGGVRPIGQEITEIRRRNMKHNPLKCRGLWLVREWNRKKMYPPGWKTLCLGQKNSEKNIYFSWKNCFFSLRSKKATIFPREIKVRLRIFLSLAYCFQQVGTYIPSVFP
jgi:hypothetical protein